MNFEQIALAGVLVLSLIVLTYLWARERRGFMGAAGMSLLLGLVVWTMANITLVSQLGSVYRDFFAQLTGALALCMGALYLHTLFCFFNRPIAKSLRCFLWALLPIFAVALLSAWCVVNRNSVVLWKCVS